MHGFVLGPIRAHYVATYACPIGEFGDSYIAHFRLFVERPASFWDAGHVHDEWLLPIFSNPEAALHSAAVKGWKVAGCLPGALTQQRSAPARTAACLKCGRAQPCANRFASA
jgi:hypothetical protein